MRLNCSWSKRLGKTRRGQETHQRGAPALQHTYILDSKLVPQSSSTFLMYSFMASSWAVPLRLVHSSNLALAS